MKILVATDGSRHSRSAVDVLKRTPFASPGNEIRVLAVVPSAKRAPRALRHEGETLARSEAQRLRDVGCTAHPVLQEGHVTQCIVAAAEEFDAGLVVVGSRCLSGTQRLLLGSVSQKTVKYTPCSVLVVRPPDTSRADPGTKTGSPLRVLVAFDGSPTAWAVVEKMASLPLPDETEITIATALPLITRFRTDIIQTAGPEWQRRKAAAQAGLESAALVLRRATPRVSTELREGGDESREILKLANELDTDMIVLGHTGKSAIQRLLLGSVSYRVAQQARCSVWVVRMQGLSSLRD